MTIQDLLQKLHSWEQVKGYSEGELNMLRACIYEVESYAESQCESVQWDCISRQAAVSVLNKECETIDLALESPTLMYEIRERLHQRRGQNREDVEAIKALPSAEPERKKGEWEYDKDGIPRCNKCNKRTAYETRFCPYCGADMRGDDNG